MTADARKHSYTIPCASEFRDAVTALSRRRRVNVGDLARSVLLVVPADVIETFPDPGEPSQADRETVILKSGAAKGRPWRRKPRLQVRMTPGYDVEFMRKALGIALALARGDTAVRLTGSGSETGPGDQGVATPGDGGAASAAEAAGDPAESRGPVVDPEEITRLRTIVSVLSFEPLPNGVKSRGDALYVLGFPPGHLPDATSLRARFRMLATIHHPDSEYGDHRRMSQLNTAMDILRRGGA